MNRSLISYLLGKTFLLCCKALSRGTVSLGAKDFPFEDDPLTREHLQGMAPLLLIAKFALSWSIPWFYSSLSKMAAWTFPIRPAKFCWTKVQVEDCLYEGMKTHAHGQFRGVHKWPSHILFLFFWNYLVLTFEGSHKLKIPHKKLPVPIFTDRSW